MRALPDLPPFVLARQEALLSRDWKVLDHLLDESLQYVHATGVRHDKPAYLDFVRGQVHVLAIQLEATQVQLIGDVCWITGRLRQTIVRLGETNPVEVVSWVTEVWRMDDAWRLAAFQSTRSTD